MKKLYSFELDWGRMGCLEGLFIAEEKEVAEVMGKTVYFGEALGKHSDVYDDMTEDMFTVVDVPDEVINILEEKIGTTISGYNPIEHYREDE